MTLRVCAPDIFSGDAVGNHCIGFVRMAERLGMPAEMYASGFDEGTHGVRPLDALFDEVARDDVVLLSYSIFDPYLERILALDCRKICYFHGVTDPQLLRALEPRTAQLCEQALAQLPLLARFDMVVANSLNTAQSLAGNVAASAIRIVPPVFPDMYVFRREPPHKSRKRPAPNLLMVGRVVPHKRIEDGIGILALLKQCEFNATLSIVGSTPNYDYLKFLINHARSLGVLEQVDFKGMLDDADLFECYESTNGLLAMSRHEGFCVPVLEAMHYGKPVFVRGGTAAHEICPPDCVFDAEAELATWVAPLMQRLGQAGGRCSVDMDYVKHADGVLQRASDEVWSTIFAAIGVASAAARSPARPHAAVAAALHVAKK
ncbi:glycosyltransferase family 4 protein [Paraburkholderia sp. Ac-20342]|nr:MULTISPECIES: glycosyltransferase family 4 protein [Burkholderiaceae]MBN3845285.1 glycosyltransferase family 4 protein [Paraburkholderia sp. Ac-20342]NIF50716.1 glycosyltransferase family 4 protein [Burkholderia sp. Ax-1724]